jgi:hypothetical protein
MNVQSVTERSGLILGSNSTYQKTRKNVHINMNPETFNLEVTGERVNL